MKFSFGSDPELMVSSPKGSIVSAIGIVPSKDAKSELGNGHQAFYDNVNAECNISAGKDRADTVAKFRECFRAYAKLIAPNRLTPRASHYFPKSEMKHEDAWVFACNPDFCAYDLTQNIVPFCDPESNFRTAGAHIHIGGSAAMFKDEMKCIWLIRMLDLFAGVPSLYIDHDPTSVERRSLYGCAGSHRPQSYGVEYRALGNFWVSSPKLVELMWDISSLCVDIVSGNQHEKIYKLYTVEQIKTCINKGDKKIGNKLMEIVENQMPKSLYERVVSFKKPYKFDFYKEWGIE